MKFAILGTWAATAAGLAVELGCPAFATWFRGDVADWLRIAAVLPVSLGMAASLYLPLFAALGGPLVVITTTTTRRRS